MRILILCTGNSCRSQMVHGFLKSLDKSLEVYSAGTNPASQVNPRAIQVMQEIGIDLSTHRPQSVKTYLDEAWDYVITVCGGANETCPMFVGKVGKRLHIGFDDPSEIVGNNDYVMTEFHRVRDEINKRFTEFYATDILKRNLPKCEQTNNY